MARGRAKTPSVRSRGRGGLPKLGVAGSNPVRRSLEATGITEVSECSRCAHRSDVMRRPARRADLHESCSD